MHDLIASQYGPWVEPLFTLAAGTAIITGLAALAASRFRAAVWQRTVWQVAILAIMALGLADLTGLGKALVLVCRTTSHEDSPSSPTWESGQSPCGTPSADGFAPPVTPESELPAQASPPGTAAAGPRDIGLSALTPYDTTARLQPLSREREWGASGPAPDAALFPSSAAADGTSAASRFAADGTSAAVSELRVPWWPAAVWLAGTAIVFGQIAWSGVMLSMFRRRCRVHRDPALALRVEGVARRLSLGREVPVLEAAGLRAPVAFWIVRPTVVLPVELDEDFDPLEQEAMLAHELGHLASHDPAWRLAADLLCALIWWHPLAWWLRRRLWAATETAADEASLLVADGPDVLAGCLVALGRRLVSPRPLGWLSVEGAGFRSNLGRRVERLLSLRGRSWRRPRRGLLLAVRTALPPVLVLVVVLCTAWAQPRADLEGGPTMNVLLSSWRRSLAAMAVAAVLGPVSGDATAAEPPAEKPKPAAQVKEEPRGEKREGDRREGREGQPERAKIARHIQELQEAREKILQILRGLGPDRQDSGDARELKEKLQKIEGQLRELRADAPRERPNRERIEHRLAELKEAIHKAAEAGRKDEAERLEREARELARILEQGQPRPDRPRREGPQSPEDVERRMQHIRAAVENLRAAGLNEQAERLMENAEQMMRRAGEGREPRPEGPRPDRPGPGVDQLREEVQQLRNEMREMREQIKRLLERERRPDR
jgi:beta-lactamase regulating signal transducer with metallopeptidase domain